MYRKFDDKKLYVTPVVSFEMIEDDDRALMASVTIEDEEAGGNSENIGGDDDPEAKHSDFVFENDFNFQIDGIE